MTWLKNDDSFPSHRKIRRLPDGAYRLHHTAMCYAAHDETDGLIQADDIEEMQHGKRLRKHIPVLVDAGLWEPVDGGWVIHDFLDYNPSHEQLETKREADRERQNRSRMRRAGTPDTPPPAPDDEDVSRRDSRVTRSGVTPSVTPPRPDPSRPDPSRPARGVLSVVGDGDQNQIVTHVTGAS